MDVSSSPQIIEHLSHSTNFTPFDAKWVPMSARIATVGCHPKGSGAIQVLELDGNKLKMVAEAEKKDGFKCSTFGAASYEQRNLATGDYSGNLAVWDLDRLSGDPVFSVKGHASIINSIDGVGGLNIGYGAPEIVTGSRDGCVKVWDIRQTEPVSSLEPASGQSARDCWSVCFGNSFNDSERVVAAGYDNGDIKLLCLRTNRLLWETNVSNGVVGLQFDRKDIAMNKLAVTSLESKFRVYDMRTFHAPDSSYAFLTESAHKSTVWLARHLPQNRDVLLTTGGNGTLNLYKYEYPAQRSVEDSETGAQRGVAGSVSLLNSRKLSDQPIVALDWHADKQGLFVCTALDQTIKIGITTKLNTI